MRIGGGPDGGIADRRGVEAQQGVFASSDVVEGGDLHEEVVRMLAVDDRLAEGGLALLEEQWILAAGDGGGFEGEHRAEGKLARTKLPHRHGHDPVGGEEFVPAASRFRLASRSLHLILASMLLYVGDEGRAVQHQHPAGAVRHDHVHRSRCRLDARAGREMVQLRVDQVGGLLHHIHLHRGLRLLVVHRAHIHSGHVRHRWLLRVRGGSAQQKRE